MIVYTLDIQGGPTHTFAVDPRRAEPAADADLPSWADLRYHQCTNCPLDGNQHAHCPAAADTAAIVSQFVDVVSYTKVKVTVRTDERTYVKDCDVQTALHSILGLVMATSACPILGELHAMGENHLPFSTTKETIYRTCSNYLLKEFFQARKGGTPDYELVGLRKLYDDLQTVNTCFVKRISDAAVRDASLNALVSLFSVAVLVRHSLDDDLDQLADLFG